jgi:hypothetical protein
VHYQLYQAEDMRNWILLNNKLTVTIFCNPNLVSNIQNTTNKALNLVINARILQTSQKATIPGWGEVWFNPYAITNIFSYLETAKHHCITYNSQKEDAFTVHLSNKKVKFTKFDQGLYIYKPKIKQLIETQVQFINTINKNKAFFTHCRFEHAKQARELYHAYGTPSIQDFKAILCMNFISNYPVTIEDIKIAQQIFGLDIRLLMGKIKDYIKLPEEFFAEQQNIVLCIDSIKVNGLMFLITISKNLYYRTAQYIRSKFIVYYKKALKEIIKIYNKAGF